MLVSRIMLSVTLVALAAELLCIYHHYNVGWAAILSVPVVSGGMAIFVSTIQDITKEGEEQ